MRNSLGAPEESENMSPTQSDIFVTLEGGFCKKNFADKIF